MAIFDFSDYNQDDDELTPSQRAKKQVDSTNKQKNQVFDFSDYKPAKQEPIQAPAPTPEKPKNLLQKAGDFVGNLFSKKKEENQQIKSFQEGAKKVESAISKVDTNKLNPQPIGQSIYDMAAGNTAAASAQLTPEIKKSGVNEKIIKDQKLEQLKQDFRVGLAQTYDEQTKKTAKSGGGGAGGPQDALPQQGKMNNYGATATAVDSMASFVAGAGDVVSGTGKALKWMGADGMAAKLIEKGGEYQAMKADTTEFDSWDWKHITNPRLYTTMVMRGVPFTLSAMWLGMAGGSAGVAVGTKLGLGVLGKTLSGAIGGAAASRPFESAIQAGEAYDQVLTETGDAQKANKAANKTFAGTVAAGGVIDIAQLVPVVGPIVQKTSKTPVGKEVQKSLLRSMAGWFAKNTTMLAGQYVSEGFEELLQENISNWAMDKDQDWTSPESQMVFNLGGLQGLIFGAGGIIVDAQSGRDMTPEVTQLMIEKGKQLDQEFIDKTIDDVPGLQEKVAIKIQEGVEESQAKIEVIDTELKGENKAKIEEIAKVVVQGSIAQEDKVVVPLSEAEANSQEGVSTGITSGVINDQNIVETITPQPTEAVGTIDDTARESVGRDEAGIQETGPVEVSKALSEYYSKAEDQEALQQSWYETMSRMEVAQAGQRLYQDGEVVGGLSSTFPEFIPPELRIKKLFDSVLPGMIDPNNLVYPPDSQPRKQELFEILITELDSAAGTDGGSVIVKTKEQNAKSNKTTNKAPKSSNSSITRSKGPVKPKQKEKIKDSDIDAYIAKRGSVKFREFKQSVVQVVETKLFRTNTQDFRDAMDDVLTGKVAVSKLPVLVEKNNDGSLSIIDGNHRVAQALLNNEVSLEIMTDEVAYRKLSELEGETTQYIKGEDGKFKGSKPSVQKKIENYLAKNNPTKFRDQSNIKDRILAQGYLTSPKRDINIKDIYGEKALLKSGEPLNVFKLDKNQFLIDSNDGQWVLNKSQWENIRNQSIREITSEFAPELKNIDEVVLGKKNQLDKLPTDYYLKEEDGFWGVFDSREVPGSYNYRVAFGDTKEEARSKALKILSNDINSPVTKFEKYTLKGGKNYREILIKAPKDKIDDVKLKFTEGAVGQYNTTVNGRLYGILKEKDGYYVYEKDGVLGQVVNTYEDAVQKIESTVKAKDFKKVFISSHFSNQQNVLSHLRINDRTYEGKKVTFMEELQSDWALEGRKRGFIKPKSEVDTNKITAKFFESEVPEGADPNNYPGYWESYDADGNLITRHGGRQTKEKVLEEAKRWLSIDTGDKGVPNNPFLKNWQESTIKRALQEAVNSNSEYLSWTTGSQQKDRYNLSKEINNIEWRMDTGEKKIQLDMKNTSPIGFAIDKSGKITEALEGRGTSDWVGKNVEDVIGKGLAEKILEKNVGKLEGAGLDIGGQWAVNMYDRQVPNILKKLTGQETEMIDMELKPDKQSVWFDNENKSISQSDLKVGDLIYQRSATSAYNPFIIATVGENGEFKAFGRNQLIREELKKFQEGTLSKKERDIVINEIAKDFKLEVPKNEKQPAIKITQEIREKVLGEVPTIKQPINKTPYGKQPIEMFRVKDDVKRFTGKTITNAQEQELMDLNKKIFGDDNVKITLQIMANKQALGSSYDGMITIVDGQANPKDTFLHEAVHKYIDVFTTKDEQIKLFQAGIDKYNTTDLNKVEESIAEDFISYANGQKVSSNKLVALFEKIINRIKLYFKNQDAIETLYNDILSGRAKEATKINVKDFEGTTEKPLINRLAETLEPSTKDIPKKDNYSRFQERLEEQLLDINGQKYNWDETTKTYDKISLEADAKKASKLLAENPEKAMRIAKGFQDPSATDPVLFDVINAVALQAFEEGNVELGTRMINRVSLTATRYGQNIVTLRGNFNNNSPQNYIKQVIDARLEKLGSSSLAEVEKLIGKKASAKTKAIAKVDLEVEKLKKRVDKKLKLKQSKIQLAQEIIDSITCA